MKTLIKRCPICKKIWIVSHDMFSLGESWLECDFENAFAQHLLRHNFLSVLCKEEIATQCYHYNGSCDKKALTIKR